MRMEKQNIPSASRSKVNIRFRNYSTDIDEIKRKLKSLSDDRKALFGDRYTDEPVDEHLEQRQQLLSGTERLERSSARLQGAQRTALETEDIGRNVLADLYGQRETIQHTRDNLQQSEGYVDTSIKTLRGMARRYCALLITRLLSPHGWAMWLDEYLTDNYSHRMATNRIITIAIITVLVLLIVAVIFSKFH